MTNEVPQHNSASGCFSLYCIINVQQQGIINVGVVLCEYVEYLDAGSMILLLILFTKS